MWYANMFTLASPAISTCITLATLGISTCVTGFSPHPPSPHVGCGQPTAGTPTPMGYPPHMAETALGEPDATALPHRARLPHRAPHRVDVSPVAPLDVPRRQTAVTIYTMGRTTHAHGASVWYTV